MKEAGKKIAVILMCILASIVVFLMAGKRTLAKKYISPRVSLEALLTAENPTGASITPVTGPSVTPATGPSITPTGPSITPVTGPSVTPTTGPSMTPTQTPTPTMTVTPTVTPTPRPTVTPGPTPSPTPEPEPKVIAVLASYDDTTAVVGMPIQTSKLKVFAFYSDGKEVPLGKAEYTLSADTIEKVGANTIVVVYKTFNTNFTVVGKKPMAISVSANRFFFSVGNAVDKRDIKVSCTYSDGSIDEVSDYVIGNGVLAAEGPQKIRIVYSGLSAELTVYGQKAKPIKALTASLVDDKTKVFINKELDPLIFTVTAIYTDATTERITNFTMSPGKIESEGKYDVTFKYNGQTCVLQVEAVKRKAVSMTAEYDGTTVMIGENMREEHLKVYVTFDDGNTEEVEDYKIYNAYVRYIGENEMRVHYEGVQTTFNVNGTAYIPPSFDYTSSYTVGTGKNKFTVTAAIPVTLPQDALAGEQVTGGKVKKVFRRLKAKGSYIAFTIGFADDDNDSELPLDMRFSLPEGYEMEKTELYYAPDLRKILGKMNKKIVSETEFESTIYNVGYYMLVYIQETEEDEE